MSKFHGMLLFDIAEDSINGWNENLGTRGYYEKWEKNNMIVTIELDEDCVEESWLVYYFDDNTVDCLFAGEYNECKQAATEYMEQH